MISDIALKRPVGAVVLSLAITLMGIVGINFLGVRLYPSIDPPIISVSTSYTGANVEIIESQITEPLEKAINGIEGVKSISSQSSLGSSRITVEFELGSDLEKAANDVRDKVSQSTRNLPQDLNAPPTVSKADADSEPIIRLVVQSTKMTPMELSDYTENVLQEKIQTIPGISSVSIAGQQRPAMRLWLDPARMAAQKLTAADVRDALDRENVEMPGGKLQGSQTELVLKTYGRLTTVEDFNNLIIKEEGGQIVRFSDIGEAVIGVQEEGDGARINGNLGVVLIVTPLPGANNIEIADEFYNRLEQIKKTIPEGMELSIAQDRSIFIRESVKDVVQTLIIALVLVVIIIFLFFRSWIIAVRPLFDMPVSLIGTFFVLYMLGYSINVLTLLGIVLATGLVVDDGIVITENIFKRLEKGMNKWQAAYEGTREVFFAVVSTSVTLGIVFVPIFFLQGFTGRLFSEFAVVMISTIAISTFVALTLTPVLNVKFGRRNTIGTNKFYQSTEPFFVWLDNKYRKVLAYFIVNKWLSLALLGFCLIVIITLGGTLKSELAPLEDQSFIRTSITAPEGTEYNVTRGIIDEVAQISIDSITGVDYVFARYGGGGSSSMNSGFMFTFLSDPEDRKATQQELYEKLSGIYRTIPDARVIASQLPTISTRGSGGLPVQFVLQTLEFEKLKEILPQFLDEAQKSPIFSNVDVNLKFNKPEIDIKVDKLKANTLGVSEQDVSTTLALAYSGTRYGYFLQNNKQYYIVGQVYRKNRMEPADVSSLFVRSSKGEMIQLDNVLTIEENSSPPILYHYNRYKSATVSANLAEGRTLGEGIQEMERIADELLDESFNTALSGQSRDFSESSANIAFALILALLLIYLILAAQFESFRDPFVIMLTVPMAMAGALLSLWAFGQTINIFSQIGVIMLIGIVTKNAILIVEFANQKRKAGMPKRVAAFESAAARFRPILMTSLAAIFGALPIALALGAGAESRVSLGIVVVGGLLFALILTLFVIPVAYILISAKNKTYAEEVVVVKSEMDERQ